MSRPATSALHPEYPSPGVVLELLKPITWFPPMWAFGCGVVSAGVPAQGRWLTILAGVILCGPLLCASSQAVNDWFDRHVDAINEPNRPIPSGRMPGRWGLYVAIAWSLMALAWAAALGTPVFVAAGLGVVLSWAYSMPPVRLKQNGWWGNTACAICYEGFAWVTGATLMAGGQWPSLRIFGIAALYSLGTHGIMTLNDFKSIDGDRRLGVGSLPVRLGAEAAGKVACAAMALPQAVVVGLLFHWDRPWHALAVSGVLAAQLACMVRLLKDPKGLAPWYNATGVSLFVSGMMISAFALRGLAG